MTFVTCTLIDNIDKPMEELLAQGLVPQLKNLQVICVVDAILLPARSPTGPKDGRHKIMELQHGLKQDKGVDDDKDGIDGDDDNDEDDEDDDDDDDEVIMK
ncbi:hypothetical protein PoB_006296800 [Plakobranchus ocellatus]|uniref:Uncharacterized protein n=1 Tax=Plakobranchus ocellatus TaxID=259542 RepID=A0AAV4CX55_9GAST|nr:hypothetical protein PoB_006296800 [Plakobranchus ocellatus]